MAFGRLQGRYPGGKFLFCLIAIRFVLQGDLGSLDICVERRVQNRCMSMYVERVWLVWMRGVGIELVGDIVFTD